MRGRDELGNHMLKVKDEQGYPYVIIKIFKACGTGIEGSSLEFLIRTFSTILSLELLEASAILASNMLSEIFLSAKIRG